MLAAIEGCCGGASELVVEAGTTVLGVDDGGGGFSPAVEGGVLEVLDPGEVGPGVGGPPPAGGWMGPPGPG